MWKSKHHFCKYVILKHFHARQSHCSITVDINSNLSVSSGEEVIQCVYLLPHHWTKHICMFPNTLRLYSTLSIPKLIPIRHSIEGSKQTSRVNEVIKQTVMKRNVFLALMPFRVEINIEMYLKNWDNGKNLNVSCDHTMRHCYTLSKTVSLC